ncbi:hypothetical protein BCE_1709 [Bacillus cereus ATCC 10987]|uniref:Uncharacterized protein n=1 Tax=Bacillus cereus (strain ATCC 10987 / NRS 248) TaxID=222523 RepID=Q73AR3_BACC1|nr:hypothetical protein BCE_1709 [Bacillus cereus ATCC 10987]
MTVNASYGLLLEMYEITFGLGFGGSNTKEKACSLDSL